MLALVLFFSICPSGAFGQTPKHAFVVLVFCSVKGGGYNFGNGVVINAASKYILTVAHILEGPELFIALPKDDKAMLYPASLIWVDRRQDAAILQLNDAASAPQLVQASLSTAHPTVGSPAKIFGFRESSGNLVAMESKFTVWYPSVILPNGQEKARILLSAKPVSSLDDPGGLSGCPLLNEEGRVMGIQKGHWGETYLFVPMDVVPENFR